MRDDSDLSLLFPPADTCYICGMAHTTGANAALLASPADDCSRCGATSSDIKLLLRAGANAYADAREAALAHRYADARRHLRFAASLGLGQSAAWWELSRLVGKCDPGVGAKETADYTLAHHLAKEGRFDAVWEMALKPTPIVDELRRLCENAQRQTRQQYGAIVVKYTLWGAFCAFITLICGC